MLRLPVPRPWSKVIVAESESEYYALTCDLTVQDQKKDKDDEYIEALKKGGIDEKVAKQVLDKWKEVGQEADPASLRKLFAKQSFAPVAASGLQARYKIPDA